MARTDLAESQLSADAFAQRWRPRFPILADCTYLVTHSLGAMPESVRDKLQAYADQWATRGVRAWAEGWWDAPVRVGDLLGRILNAPPGTVAMHQNVSVIESPHNRTPWAQIYVTDPDGNVIEFNVERDT